MLCFPEKPRPRISHRTISKSGRREKCTGERYLSTCTVCIVRLSLFSRFGCCRSFTSNQPKHTFLLQDLAVATAEKNGATVILASDPDVDRFALAEKQE